MTETITTSGDDLTVRVLTTDDAEAFRSLRLDALRLYPHVFSKSYEDEAVKPLETFVRRVADPTSPDSFIVGAFEGERLVAMVGFRRDDRRKLLHRATIWGVYTDAAYRGRGIARRLMTAALERGSQAPGLRQVHLTVLTDNHSARHLYDSLGFIPYGEDRGALCVDGIFYDETMMALYVEDRPQ